MEERDDTSAICINRYLSPGTLHLRTCNFQLPFVPKPRCYSSKIWWSNTCDHTPQLQMLSLQTTREVRGLWHGSLEKDFFDVYYLEKLLLGFLQSQLFPTGSVLWYHEQPSCFVLVLHCCWDTVAELSISYCGSWPWPLCSIDHSSHFLQHCCARSLDWRLWLGSSSLVHCDFTRPTVPTLKLQARSQKRGRALASSRFCTQATDPLHFRPWVIQARFERMSQKFPF